MAKAKSEPLKIIAREAFFIKMSSLTSSEIEEAYERNSFQFYNEANCERCPYFQERPCDTCEECPQNLGLVKMAKKVDIGSNRYLSLPLGDTAGLKSIFENRELNIVAKFPIVKMKHPVKFTGKLRPEQVEAVETLKKKRRGVLRSPPRTGKTVMASAMICDLGYKTIIMAAQRDWLVNFHETFVGSGTQKPLTNISKKNIGFAKTYEEFKKYDIALCTYQTFNSPKGQKLLERISQLFTCLFVDECFTYGHRIRTELGMVSIGDIVRGKVNPSTALSYNHETDITEFKKIESITEKKTKQLVRLTVGGKSFLCTPNHKFWVPSLNKYVQAKHLTPGLCFLLHRSM